MGMRWGRQGIREASGYEPHRRLAGARRGMATSIAVGWVWGWGIVLIDGITGYQLGTNVQCGSSWGA